MLGNLSIGKKIVGLSLVLLSVMLAASIYSFVQTTRVRDAMADMAGALIPLSAELNAIERTSLEQALMLERAVRHINTDDAEQARSEVQRFRELNTEVDSHLNKAQQFMKVGLAHTALVDDAIHLARLDPELDTLRREHSRYSELGLSLVGNARQSPQQWHDLKEQLSVQEDRLDETIDRLAERLDTASGREAALVSERQAQAYLVSAESLGLAITAFLLGSIFSALVTRRLVRPVRALISGAQEVTRGNLDVVVDVSTSDEVGTLALAFQNMIVELRAKARIKETFGKYLDPRVVERLIGDGQSALGGGEKKVMTVFFSDLQGFSSISESLTAAGLVNLINNYLTLASEPIVANEGVIDKYIGDAIMAFWGPPFCASADHARRACVAALAQYEQLAELKRRLPDILGIRRNLPDLHVRIGLCTGELIMGSIGSNVSKSFTVMGDTVNTASRLESANKQFGTRILMDGQTFDMVQGDMEARQLDLLQVAGKDEAVRVYELLGVKGQVEAARLELRDAFEAGLKAYRVRDWDLAERHFAVAAEIDPQDKPVSIYLERIRTFREAPPLDGWAGVWRFTRK